MPQCLGDILGVFDNGSVAAFLGAFFAFLLVVATDARRKSNKLSRLRLLIGDNGAHALRKLEMARTACDMLRSNKFVPTPVMRFPLDSVKHLRLEVIDLLESDENRSIDALLYWMEAIDGLFDEAYQESKELLNLVKKSASNQERTARAKTMLITFEEAAKNLEHLAKMCNDYVAKDYGAILNVRHEIK